MSSRRAALALAALVTVACAAPAGASAAGVPGTTPVSFSIRGSATITSTWIDQEACAQGYRASLVQRITLRMARPMRLGLAVIPGNPLFTATAPSGASVTTSSRTPFWTTVAPLGCSSGALLEPKPLPAKPACPVIAGRVKPQLISLPAKGSDPELAPISRKDEGGATLQLTLTRTSGPRSSTCRPDLPPNNTAPVGKEDAEGATTVVAVPGVRGDVFVGFPLKTAGAVVATRRSKREWIVKVDGDCTDLNVVGRDSREQPGPDGDELSCVVKGRFVVALRNLQR